MRDFEYYLFEIRKINNEMVVDFIEWDGKRKLNSSETQKALDALKKIITSLRGNKIRIEEVDRYEGMTDEEIKNHVLLEVNKFI